MKITEKMRVKVRAGQYWKKKDTGLIAQISGSCGDGVFGYRSMNGKANSHRVRAKELWMFWEKI